MKRALAAVEIERGRTAASKRDSESGILATKISAQVL